MPHFPDQNLTEPAATVPAPEDFAGLHGRRAVVTGASSGIGREIAREFARAGADVVIHCRKSVDQAEELAEEIRGLGRRAEILAADFAETRHLTKFVDDCWQALGGINLWVNNAGVDLLTGEGAQLDYAEKLQWLLDVDVRATVLLSKHAAAKMSAEGGGGILNIGWDQADRGMAGDSGELFATSKNAVMGFTRSLAVSLAPSVRVNCIAPGWIQTAWGEQASETWQERVRRETPLERWGTPPDIARLARFLASEEAAYITGQVINANGGAVR